MKNQLPIDCVLMRGGTSKATFFLESDLPEEEHIRDEIILRALGAGSERGVDGVGGLDPLANKVAVISKSTQADVDIDYLFAQASLSNKLLDKSLNCGNVLSAVGPFAIEAGLVASRPHETTVRIRNLNTGTIVHASVRTEDGRVVYAGDTEIDGVPGSGAPIYLNFINSEGSKTGRLLPTGNSRDRFDGLEYSCVDVAVPVIILRASDLGKSGYETPTELSADSELIARLNTLRCEVGRRIGLGDVSSKVIPKLVLAAPPRVGGNISSRYFIPHKCHAAHAVTGAIALGSACRIEGTIAHELCGGDNGASPEQHCIEHPAGKIAVRIVVEQDNDRLHVPTASLVRTARRLFAGKVYIPLETLSSHLAARDERVTNVRRFGAHV